MIGLMQMKNILLTKIANKKLSLVILFLLHSSFLVAQELISDISINEVIMHGKGNILNIDFCSYLSPKEICRHFHFSPLKSSLYKHRKDYLKLLGKKEGKFFYRLTSFNRDVNLEKNEVAGKWIDLLKYPASCVEMLIWGTTKNTRYYFIVQRTYDSPQRVKSFYQRIFARYGWNEGSFEKQLPNIQLRNLILGNCFASFSKKNTNAFMFIEKEGYTKKIIFMIIKKNVI